MIYSLLEYEFLHQAMIYLYSEVKESAVAVKSLLNVSTPSLSGFTNTAASRDTDLLKQGGSFSIGSNRVEISNMESCN
jgi:hypothetical protein